MSSRFALAPLAAAVALAGCGSHDKDTTKTDTASISIGTSDNSGDRASGNGQSVAIQVPGFSGKFNVPGLSIGADNMNIDGIRFRPGSKIAGVNIVGDAGDGSGGENHGTVEMRFTDPAAPDQVLAYYKAQARADGWTEVPPAAGQQFAATKQKSDGAEHLAMQITTAAGGSTGRFLVTGG